MNRHERRAAAAIKSGVAPDGKPIFKLSGEPVVQTEEQRAKRLGITVPALRLADAAMNSNRNGCYVAGRTAAIRALAICPDNPHLLNVLGMITWNLGDYERGEAALRRSIELAPGDYQAYSNLGVMLSSTGRLEEAKAAFAKSILANKDKDLHPRWDRAICLLSHGDWPKGLEEYENRFAFRGPSYYPKMPMPTWKGEPLDGRSIYIQGEQGIGDRLLFSRYVAVVRERYPTAKIFFLPTASYEQQLNLTQLFWNFRDLDIELVPPETPYPKADFGCYLLSLPHILGLTDPESVPADPGLLRKRVEKDIGMVDLTEPTVPGIKVGIAWTGSADMGRNAERSVPLRMMLELAENPEALLFSLQFNDGAQQFAGLGAGSVIIDLAPGISPRGLVGTAAVIVNLDLVITCCTSVAHLAGALGVPCFVLLCHDPYWVWLRDRSDSPFYPSVRLFRQPKPNDWRPVIDEVKEALADYARDVLRNRPPNPAA